MAEVWMTSGASHRRAARDISPKLPGSDRGGNGLVVGSRSSSGPARSGGAEQPQVVPPVEERRAEIVAARDRAGEGEDPVGDAVVASGHAHELAFEAIQRLAEGDEVEPVLADAAV